MQFIGKPECKKIREAVQAALDMVGEDLGIGLSMGSISYRGTQASFKVTAVAASSDGSVDDPNTLAFKEHCLRFGLTKEHLGCTFNSRGVQYQICGLAPKSYKYPILARSTKDGKTYKHSAGLVREALGLDEYTDTHLLGNPFWIPKDTLPGVDPKTGSLI